MGGYAYYEMALDPSRDLSDGYALGIETMCVMSALIIGMCLFRWCSLNDISPKTIWQRVAVTQPSPLRIIKWNLDTANIFFVEYIVDYGHYPHALHEPVVTLSKQQRICNARDLIKITKKDPDPEHIYSHGAIYFHFKGEDEYLLDRWKYEFGKYHNKVENVFSKCNRFHSIFLSHFGGDKDRSPHSNWNLNEQPTTEREKENAVGDILDGLNVNVNVLSNMRLDSAGDEDEEDEFYMNTHDHGHDALELSDSEDDAVDIRDIDPSLMDDDDVESPRPRKTHTRTPSLLGKGAPRGYQSANKHMFIE